MEALFHRADKHVEISLLVRNWDILKAVSQVDPFHAGTPIVLRQILVDKLELEGSSGSGVGDPHR